MRVGLTGGVGSGKSTAAAVLAEHGAVVVDADAIAHEVVEPGTPGLDAVVARFGADVLTADGRLDRPAMAEIVFADADDLAALNAIVHPLVGRRVAEVIDQAPADAVIVNDVPLLVENNPSTEGFDFVVVVEAALATRLQRLAGRGMSESDARKRIAVQATDEQRRAVADAVIDNDGTHDQLRAQVDAVWVQILSCSSRPDR